MALFETIFKELLLEASKEDIYNKFYSDTISLYDFNYITTSPYLKEEKQKWLPIYKFICDNIKNGTLTVDEAKNIIDNVNNQGGEKDSYGLIPIQVLNNMYLNGDVDDADALKIISKAPLKSVKSKKVRCKEGYIKIYEDKNCLITCTSTYEANSHYFGNTHWCTASDRDGDYDGYKMFCNYTWCSNDYYYDDEGDEVESDSTFPCVLIQYQSNNYKLCDDDDGPEDSYKLFQLQIGIDDDNNISFKQICNFYDKQCDEDQFIEMSNISIEIFDRYINNAEIIASLIEKTENDSVQEEKIMRALDIVMTIKKRKVRTLCNNLYSTYRAFQLNSEQFTNSKEFKDYLISLNEERVIYNNVFIEKITNQITENLISINVTYISIYNVICNTIRGIENGVRDENGNPLRNTLSYSKRYTLLKPFEDIDNTIKIYQNKIISHELHILPDTFKKFLFLYNKLDKNIIKEINIYGNFDFTLLKDRFIVLKNIFQKEEYYMPSDGLYDIVTNEFIPACRIIGYVMSDMIFFMEDGILFIADTDSLLFNIKEKKSQFMNCFRIGYSDPIFHYRIINTGVFEEGFIIGLNKEDTKKIKLDNSSHYIESRRSETFGILFSIFKDNYERSNWYKYISESNQLQPLIPNKYVYLLEKKYGGFVSPFKDGIIYCPNSNIVDSLGNLYYDAIHNQYYNYNSDFVPTTIEEYLGLNNDNTTVNDITSEIPLNKNTAYQDNIGNETANNSNNTNYEDSEEHINEIYNKINSLLDRIDNLY